jgi:uncharacterized protein (TIGR02996 family)
VTADLAPLLAAIFARPQDDAPRLALAERLAAEGQPARAELIRRQCELARLPEDSPERAAAWPPIAALLEAHAATWLGDLAAVASARSFWRGMVESVDATSADVVAVAAALEREAPLANLTIEAPDEEGAETFAPGFLELGLLERVRALHLGEGCSAGDAARALAAPRLARLSRFSLFDGQGFPAAIGPLSEALSPALRDLAFIGLASTYFDDACAARLAAAPGVTGLEHLRLWNCNLREAGALALARSPNLAKLRSLFLGLGQYTRNQIGPRGCAALAAEAALPSLEVLDLDFNDVGDEGWLAMVGSGKLARFTELRLQRCQLGDASALPMWTAPARLDALRTLDLSHNRLGPATARALAAAAPAGLRTLWLYGNPLGDEGVRALAEAPWLGQLRELNLDLVGMSDAGAGALLRSPHLAAVGRVALSLQKPALSTATLAALREHLGARLWRPPVSNLRAS